MGGILVGGRSLKIDMLGIRHKVNKLELIQKGGSIMAQGSKEAKHSLRKALKIKVQDLGLTICSHWNLDRVYKLHPTLSSLYLLLLYEVRCDP